MKGNISNIIEKFDMTTENIILISLGLWMFVLILVIVLFVKNHNLKNKYKKFMGDKDGKSLEKSISEKLKQFDIAKNEFDTVSNKIKELNTSMDETLQKVGLIKYDAFNDMGGKLSFALALLSPKNDGIVINSVHSREGSYLYLKEIVNGSSTSVALANEEKDAVDQALKSIV